MHIRRILWGAIALAFLLRVVVRLHSGAADFWINGYGFFFSMARDLAQGRGMPTAFRVPLYPVFLAILTGGRELFWPVLIAQSAIGAATAWLAAVLAAEMFNSETAAVAACITAIYPYYVVHDTALQETGLFTFLTLACIISLRPNYGKSGLRGIGPGLLLAADVLNRVTIAPFAVVAPFFLPRRAAILCAIVLLLGVSPWLIHNYRLTGSLTLSSETGMQLWDGNNPLTFSYYPRKSIDKSKAAAFEALSPSDRAELEALGSNEAAADRWFLRKGVDYIVEHPATAVIGAFRKLWAAFGWLPSPRKGTFGDIIIAASYGPIMILGLMGMWMMRGHWREDFSIYALFISFAALTAFFFGHTSHRVYLDVYWIVFASGAIVQLWNRYRHSGGSPGITSASSPQ